MKLVEKFPVTDTFVSGVGRVDILGNGFARWVLYSERKGEDGSTINVVVASYVMLTESIGAFRTMTDAALDANINRHEMVGRPTWRH